MLIMRLCWILTNLRRLESSEDKARSRFESPREGHNPDQLREAAYNVFIIYIMNQLASE